VRAILLVAILALAGCQGNEPTLGGTVLSVAEDQSTDPFAFLEESAKVYEDPLVPEVAWKVDVRLDDGSEVSLRTQGPRRYEPGERVRVLVDPDGALLL
jgi:outer membrane lipoprotein SlyB